MSALEQSEKSKESIHEPEECAPLSARERQIVDAACSRENLTAEQRALVLTAVFAVRAHASKMARIYRRLERDDLFQTGMMIVCSIASRFDSARGAKFVTFVHERVWRAMVRVGTQDRKRRAKERAFSSEVPTTKAEAAPSSCRPVTIGDPWVSATEMGVLPGANAVSQEEEAAREEEKLLLRKAIANVSPRLEPVDAAVITECLEEDATAAEIAAKLGLDKDAVVYKRSRALKQVKIELERLGMTEWRRR